MNRTTLFRIIGGVACGLAILTLYIIWAVGRISDARERSKQSVVDQVLNGSLVPDSRGIVQLPTSIAGLVAGGTVEVSNPKSSQTAILFIEPKPPGAQRFAVLWVQKDPAYPFIGKGNGWESIRMPVSGEWFVRRKRGHWIDLSQILD
jgi:hypothetical protein